MSRQNMRRRGGFTVAEVLLTVGLLGVLLALAFPNVIALRDSLRMTELDATARQIFLAAQNSLTGAKAAGPITELETAPPVAEGAALCYLTQDDAGMTRLLPAGAIDPTVADNHYIVVFNPVTGTVREVFYAQHTFDVGVAFGLSGMEEAAVQARRQAELGYYSGEDIPGGLAQALPIPTIRIENADELSVILSIPVEWRNETKLTVTATRADDPAVQKTFECFPNALGEATLVLDSLTDPSSRFQTLFAGSGFAPGDDLYIQAALESRTGGGQYIPSISAKLKTNSLFAAREGALVSVAFGRHLQNLHPAFSRVGTDVTQVRQTALIQWPEGVNFLPITNEALASYDGGELPIRDLTAAVVKEKYAGLFGSVWNIYQSDPVRLSNIRLVNPMFTGAMSATGGLAGSAAGATVTNCLVYADDPARALIEGHLAGGLIGIAIDCSISYSGAGLPTVIADTTAGGLLGHGEGALDISYCYAAVDDLQANGSAAMLIGNLKSDTSPGARRITGCYAVGNISRGAPAVSGFMNGGGTVTDSYCAVTYLGAAGGPLGLAGINGFAAGGSYAQCLYLEPRGAATAGGAPAGVSSISYDNLVARGAAATGRWVRLAVSESYPYRSALAGIAYPFPALKGQDGRNLLHYGSWPELPPSTGSGIGLAYLERYSDGGSQTQLGLYAPPSEAGGDLLDTLDYNSYWHISSSAYGLLLPHGQSLAETGNITLEMGDVFLSAPLGDSPSPVTVVADGKTYDFYSFTSSALKALALELKKEQELSEEIIVTIGNKELIYYFNPNFAAAITDMEEALGLDDALPLQVRTQSQLSAVPQVLGDRAFFRQTHTVCVAQAADWSPISLRRGDTYDGAGNLITQLRKPLFGEIGPHSNDRSPPTVKNVVIEGALIPASEDTGIFAKLNRGNVENCVVQNSSITRTGTGNASGFVDNNQGSIISSHVRSTAGYAASAVTATAGGNAYGFVRLNSSTFTIQGCSAVGTVTAANTAAGFAGQNSSDAFIRQSYANCMVSGVQNASGFITVNNWLVEDCYAMLSVYSQNGTAAGFSTSATNSGGVPFSNCYAAAQVSTGNSRNSYGFSPLKIYGDPQTYYYLDQAGLSAGTGVARTFEQMVGSLTSDLNGGRTVWVRDTAAAASHPFSSHLAGMADPFARLAAQQHYGDWPLKQPPLSGNALGLFYYERVGGQYHIYAGALMADFADKKLPISGVEQNFYNGPVFVDNPPSSPLPVQSGFGVFYPKDFTLPNDNGKKGLRYELSSMGGDSLPFSRIDTADDLGLHSDYYFLPLPNSNPPISAGKVDLTLHFGHDQGGGNWDYTFTFDMTQKTFTIIGQ